MSDGTQANDEQTYRIIGAAMAVHRELGCGFLESVYQEALEKELTLNAVSYEREKKLTVYYRGEQLNSYFKVDFICFSSVIVELKATKKLTANDDAQLLNYLKATKLKRGLLINFGAPSLEYKRLVF